MADWLEPGQHVTAMGSDAEHKNEIDPAVLARVDLCRRPPRARRAASANCTMPSRPASCAADRAFPELGQIIAGKRRAGASADAITLCDLTGTGVQDTAIATLAVRRARRRGRRRSHRHDDTEREMPRDSRR